jgi:hypothetical protein
LLGFDKSPMKLIFRDRHTQWEFFILLY